MLFRPKRYTCTAKDIEMLLALGELKGRIEAIVAENDRLKAENEALKSQAQQGTK